MMDGPETATPARRLRFEAADSTLPYDTCAAARTVSGRSIALPSAVPSPVVLMGAEGRSPAIATTRLRAGGTPPSRDATSTRISMDSSYSLRGTDRFASESRGKSASSVVTAIATALQSSRSVSRSTTRIVEPAVRKSVSRDAHSASRGGIFNAAYDGLNETSGMREIVPALNDSGLSSLDISRLTLSDSNSAAADRHCGSSSNNVDPIPARTGFEWGGEEDDRRSGFAAAVSRKGVASNTCFDDTSNNLHISQQQAAIAVAAAALKASQQAALDHARAAALAAAIAEAGEVAASLADDAAQAGRVAAQKAQAVLVSREHEAVSRAERDAAERYAAAARLTSEAVEWAQTYARDVQAAAALAVQQEHKRKAAEAEAERFRKEEAERHATAAAAAAAAEEERKKREQQEQEQARQREAQLQQQKQQQQQAEEEARAILASAIPAPSASSAPAAATASGAAQPPSASSSAAESSTISTPASVGGRSFLSAARRLVADVEASQALMVDKLGLKPECATRYSPEALAGGVPKETVAKSIWRQVKAAVTRIIGTVEMTDFAADSLHGTLCEARIADQQRPLAVLPPSVTVSTGIASPPAGLFYLYACDVIVSAVTKRAEGELPGGTTEDYLTITFAFARVLARLGQQHPLLLRRYLGILYQACPFAVPTAVSLGARDPDGNGTSVTPQKVTQLMSIYAALLTEPAGPPPPQSSSTSAAAGANGSGSEHRHGMGQAWRLLARLVNTQAPPHRMAARVLHAVLLYTGFALGKAYGPQAKALLATIATRYLPVLARVPEVEQSFLEIVRQLLMADPGAERFDPGNIPLLRQPPLGSDLPATDTKTTA